MPVDTHVFRVSNRIGLTTNSKTPLQTELTLEKNIPSHLLPVAHHWLILHGRYVCMARSPKCGECGIAAWCRKVPPPDVLGRLPGEALPGRFVPRSTPPPDRQPPPGTARLPRGA